MRRWTIRLLILLGIVAVGLALRATVLAPKPIEVTVTEVSRGRVEQTVTNSPSPASPSWWEQSAS
jgi:hypothetical protein